MLFFRMNTWTLIAVLVAILGGLSALGVLVGRRLRSRSDSLQGPLGVVQGTLLGLVGLLLAFGLTMAVGRYEERRSLVVQEADDIGTAYLRAQIISEPARTTSLTLFKRYADTAIRLSHEVPGSAEFDASRAELADLQQQLWAAAGQALETEPAGNASRLYVEALNPVFDVHTDRVSSLRNLVPTPVLLLEILGSAVALGVLALYLSMIGRGLTTSVVAAAIVLFILFVSFDLDRPERGYIRVPSTPLEDTRQLMDLPPAVPAASPAQT